MIGVQISYYRVIMPEMENLIEHVAEVVAYLALSLVRVVVDAVQKAVEVVKSVVDAVVEWVKGMVISLFNSLKSEMNKMETELGNAYKCFILAVYNKNVQDEAINIAKMMVFMGVIAGLIMGVYWGLAIAVDANPIVGMIITGLVSAAFMAVFYSLYPEEYRQAGEAIISLGDLLLKPADELYYFDKQYCGSLGWFLTAITATIGASWSGAITNSDIAVGITWALSIATLVAAIVLMNANYHDTTVKKTIAVGLLGIASYGLVSTTVEGVKSLKDGIGNPAKLIVTSLFFVLFEFISAYSVLTTIGYLHKG